MKRAAVSEILKEILELGGNPNWSVECTPSDSCELHVGPRILTSETLKQIAKKNGFGCREEKGKIVIF